MNLDELEQVWGLDTPPCEVCDGERSITLPDGTVIPCDWCSIQPITRREMGRALRYLGFIGGLWVAGWMLVGGFLYVGYRLVRWIVGAL